MEFRIELISPSDREKLTATVMVDNEQLAEINQIEQRLMLELYPRRDGRPWTLDYVKTVAALTEAKTRLLR